MKVWPFPLQKINYKPVAEEGFQKKLQKVVTEVESFSHRKRQKAPQNNQPTIANYWAELAQQNKWQEKDPSTSIKIQKTPEKIGLLYLNSHK